MKQFCCNVVAPGWYYSQLVQYFIVEVGSLKNSFPSDEKLTLAIADDYCQELQFFYNLVFADP